MTDGERLAHVAGLFRGAVENGYGLKDKNITYVMIDIKVAQRIQDWLDRSAPHHERTDGHEN